MNMNITKTYYVIFHRHGNDCTIDKDRWNLSFDILVRDTLFNRFYLKEIKQNFPIALYGFCYIAKKYAKKHKLILIGSEDFRHRKSANMYLMKCIKETIPLKRRIFLMDD